MKIEISDESFRFIKALIKEIDNQDNRCTASPYFYVIREKKTRPAHFGCGDYIGYFYDGETFDKQDLMNTFELKSEDAFEEFIDSNDFEILDFTCSHEDAEMSNVFFTEKACHDHIENNHYHFRDPKSYVKHAWRNPEIQNIIKALREIANNK